MQKKFVYLPDFIYILTGIRYLTKVVQSLIQAVLISCIIIPQSITSIFFHVFTYFFFVFCMVILFYILYIFSAFMICIPVVYCMVLR
jgi:hypothetical protein